MVKKNRIFFVLFWGVQCFSGQEIISKKDSVNGNQYSMEMDVKIDELLKREEMKCVHDRLIHKGSIKRKDVNSKLIEKKALANKIIIKPLSMADICTERPKLMGYKIQITVTNNSHDANNIRYEFRKKFPNLRIELDSSLRPNYKILAGSFFSKKSGESDLTNVRKVYYDAILIPYRIFCVESK
ncbi:SPOR domain-containing protein [Elizabethkingia anophelis]|uniref:SPOR domain-containing protein n=1 Tax=Elizabethkingia anophelis TaxID=1117645 RepID=UPI003891D6B4